MTRAVVPLVVARAVIHAEPVLILVTQLRRALARVLVTDVTLVADTEVRCSAQSTNHVCNVHLIVGELQLRIHVHKGDFNAHMEN